MSDLEETIQQIERLEYAPQLVRDQVDEHGADTLAEICAAVHVTVLEESQKRDVDKYGGIACLYQVIARLANDE